MAVVSKCGQFHLTDVGGYTDKQSRVHVSPYYIVSGQMTLVLISLNPVQPVTHYLVKWCSLPYEDSTWELRQDIDQAKIEEFEKLMSREPETERVVRIGLW